MFLMVLSCVNVTTAQAVSLQVQTAHPIKTKSPHVSTIHLAILFDKWKESLDKRSHFDKLLDTIKQPQSFQVGPNYAQDWEEYLAHKAFCCSCQGKFVEELAQDNISDDLPFTESTWTGQSMVGKICNIFTLLSSVKITHLPKSLSLELENLLVQLPTNQVCICPASLASAEILPKLSHLLCSAGPHHDQEVKFGILLDTGCSVATTRFEEDFCGQLEIKGFLWCTGRQWMPMGIWC